jgi:hypothetical protein
MPHASLDETLDVMACSEYGQEDALVLFDGDCVFALFAFRSR